MFTNISRMLLACSFVAGLGNPAAANTVIGTVELTVDGEDQTWYVVQPDGGAMATASWLALGPERGTAAITAYKSGDVALVTEETIGASVPEGGEAVVLITFSFDIGDTQKTYSLPAAAESGPVSVIFMSDWRDHATTYDMTDGPGEIDVTTIDARRDGPSRFAGTIKGTLRNHDGETLTINAGRFEVDGVRFFSP